MYKKIKLVFTTIKNKTKTVGLNQLAKLKDVLTKYRL